MDGDDKMHTWEVHAQVHDSRWLREHKHLLGDMFDGEYMKRFGFEEIGIGRTYETMVFRAGKPCDSTECGCGLPSIASDELDFGGYKNAKDARDGHYDMCEKWSSITPEMQSKQAIV